MLTRKAEIDQAEVVRSASFVNACRWHKFDNWLVHYDLGSLAFAKRRHAEADRHLKIAVQQAPDAFLYAINDLCFVNLTWLENRVPATPETLECAHAALQAPGPEDLKARIRTWVAHKTGDLSILAPVYDGDNLYEQGQANDVRRERPDALRCWMSALLKAFVPRAFHPLIKFFTASGFEQTAGYLIDVAIRESWDDFFQLWELGKVLLEVLRVNESKYHGRHQFKDLFSQVEERIERLSEFEFQHLMRAWEFYTSNDRVDLAARVLQRATQLAESPEEHLLVAIARKDRVGLDHLMHAERESTHRLERLEIARELARYRQLSRARRILKAEGVFASGERLEPLEYVIALQCGRPCLTDDEMRALSEWANENLKRDLQAGLIRKCGDRFVNRLKETATTSIDFNEWLVQTETSPELQDSVWKSWTSSLQTLHDPALFEEKRRDIESRELELGEGNAALFFYLATWAQLFETLDSTLDYVKHIRPPRWPTETPISRTDSAINVRAERVSRLWRQYLTAEEIDLAHERFERVKNFYHDEERLESEWKALRRKEMQASLERVGNFLKYGQYLLAQIRKHAERGGSWPPFLAIGEHLLRDTGVLQEWLASQMILAELGFDTGV
jgi:hypothetical protein